MKLGLINSAWLGTAVDTATGIRLTKEIGFDTIDIFADPLEVDVRERRLIRQECAAKGLPVTSGVCCALGIADFNLSVRRFHLDRVKRYADLAYELEARNVLLVLGEYIWQQEVIAPENQWQWAVEQVREAAEYASALGLELALEIEPFALAIVNTVQKMKSFLDAVDHPAAKANIDISHLVLAKNTPEDVSLMAGRIGHVHLSDCDGSKHGDLPPGRGCVDFPPYLAALKHAGFQGTISIELEYSPDPSKIVDWVREAYTGANRLMTDLQIRN